MPGEDAPTGAQPARFRFPWRAGNRFELLVDGPVFFDRMLREIEGAQREVLLEIYLAESGAVMDRFAQALVRAAARGVAVYALFDDFGARGLSAADRRRLASGGVRLAFYNALRHAKLLQNLFRDHRKLLLADARVAFVGGAGLTDEFHPEPPALPWRETMLRIEGPVVADWRALFAETWARCAGRLPPLAAAPVEAGGQRGRVATSASLRRDEIVRSVRGRIAAARERAWVATAYFVPPWSLRRALRRAARRGVDVRLLLPGPITDHPTVRQAGRRHYDRLLRAGVRIWEYQRRFLHAKAVLCDRWASVGSSNLDRWTLRWNLEANQEIDDADFARELEAVFLADFAASVEIDPVRWARRRWTVRLAEWLAGKVESWLVRLPPRRWR
ncbi:MAG: phosphatidylserine/phosphatidylglycerophosphate/cardiolipin synthase family protein [Burkholderiales bacterium]|nr:phosphatidylserine/phosphatidylglycerophosphate/cardiolipin synthase family protein [Burkholderiales bacterium]